MGMHLESLRDDCQKVISQTAIQTLNKLESPQSDKELEAEITTLTANINAATYRLLVLIAEFEKRRAWRGCGYKSCAHWLNVRCGIGMAAARERVRVACALTELPKISAAFALGKLSFSKAREMTRIAHTENEDYLLMIAQHGSAHHVAELVRKHRGVKRREASRQAMTQQREREFNYYIAEDGCLNFSGRLPPEQGAVFLQALQTALERVDFIVDEDDSTVGPENATAVAFLRNETSKKLLEEQRQKQVNGPQQRADALMLLADQFLHTPTGDQQSAEFKTADRFQVVVHVDVETLVCENNEEGEDTEPNSFPEYQHCEMDNGTTLAVDTVKRLCCDSGLLAIHTDASGNPLNIGRKTRTIPPALRRALMVRDKGCVFPGCTCRSTRYVDGHHIKHWANGGETSLQNLASLCRHHHRLVHEGGFDLQRTESGELLVFRPNGTQLMTGAPVVAAKQQLEKLNQQRNILIDETTIFRQKDSSIDYAMAVDGLLRRDGLRSLAQGAGSEKALQQVKWAED